MKHNLNSSSRILVGLVMVASLFISGCFQGRPSSKPPIHLNPNMDNQEKYKAQQKSLFFANGSINRMPIEGTVARGELYEDVAFHTGANEDGKMIKIFPMEVNMELLLRGQDRFNIYCSPCHGRTGEGNGIVVQRGMLQPTSFFDERLVAEPVGQIFNVIKNGKNNMPSYKAQIPVEDRWAIVAYFKALQKTRNRNSSDVPSDILEGMK